MMSLFCPINFQFVPHFASFLTTGNGTKINKNGITLTKTMDKRTITTSTKKLAGKTPKTYFNTLWGISVFAPLNATELLTIKLSPPPLTFIITNSYFFICCFKVVHTGTADTFITFSINLAQFSTLAFPDWETSQGAIFVWQQEFYRFHNPFHFNLGCSNVAPYI
ncbi:hypothetical protein C6501_02180 [Candidatus Poribacteria bacterium]|nr:MAG: hypothetical protein C6501_02180 [Candidatus Poribacteria bacterium]